MTLAIRALSSFNRKAFLALDLHCDFDAEGAYVYEASRNSISKALLCLLKKRRVSLQSKEIELDGFFLKCKDGMVLKAFEVRSLDALLSRYSKHALTLEAPGTSPSKISSSVIAFLESAAELAGGKNGSER